jgi:hypothetical protein
VSPFINPFISQGSLNQGIFGSSFNFAFGINSTGVILLQKGHLDFSQPTDHTLSIGSVLGLNTVLKSTSNESFVTVLPGGAQVLGFSPSTMVIQSSPTITLILGLFPWVGSAQRTLPNVSVTFHYPAFDAPVLSASWTTMPNPFYVGHNFTLAIKIANTGTMNAQKLHLELSYSGDYSWDQPSYYTSTTGTVRYDVGSILTGGSDTHNFNFLALAPDAGFSLTASYLDDGNFVYSWNTAFTVAPDVNINGPLIVTKSVTPANPSFGQNGTITFSITNTDPSNTFWNVLDLTPEAFPFLYPNGVDGQISSSNPCPYLYSIQANTTQFSFEVSSNYYCGSTVVTQVLVGNSANLYPVPLQGNIPLGPGDTWFPLFRYPATVSHNLLDPITVQVTFQNSGPLTQSSLVSSGPISSFGDPKASYLSLNCQLCPVGKGYWSPPFSGTLVNATGAPLPNQTMQFSYASYPYGMSNSVGSAATDGQGRFSFSWGSEGQLALGAYELTANFTGSVLQRTRSETIEFYVAEPTVIGPGKTITMSYPYFFNVTGPLTIEPERIAYSTRSNVTLGGNVIPLIGEYEAQSSTVSVTVSPPPISPVVDTTMDTQKLSFLYLAENQSLVKINLVVTNGGPQTASNVVVSAFIPRLTYTPLYNRGLWLPVSNNGNITVDNVRGTVTFSVPSLQPGQQASAWYIVKANSTNIFESTANVTAQAPDLTKFRFTYASLPLEVYPPLSLTTPPQQGLLENYITIDPAVIGNGTSTTVTFHLYNAGNVTYHSIIANITNIYGVTVDRMVRTAPDMAPGASQTINFMVSSNGNIIGNSSGGEFYGYVYYNQSSTVRFSQYFFQELLVYNSKIAGLNPSVRVDVSAATPVSAGAADIAVATVTNTGFSDVTNLFLSIQATSPFGNAPDTTYGAFYANWPGDLGPNQSIKFRVGIQTKAGGPYTVSVAYANYDFSQPGSLNTGRGYITGSGAATITATVTAGPEVTIPWASPFAPTPNDQENVWTQVSDYSGIGSVKLQYSIDNKQTWKNVSMTPLNGPYLTGQGTLQLQSTLGGIYNATIPAQSSGTIVFYRIKALDRLGNLSLQDYGGVDFSYTVQGGPNNHVFQQKPGTNILLNVSQSIPTLKATITLNVPIPIAIQVTQLSSNPGGTPPSGSSALGIYVQIEANVSISLVARIRLYYTSNQIQGLTANSITPYYWDGTNWVALSNVVVNTSQMWVEGTVTHFSLFAVFASSPTPANPPPTTQPPPTTTSPAQLPWLIIGATVAIVVIVVAAIGGVFYRTNNRRPKQASTLETTPTTPSPLPGNPTTQ